MARRSITLAELRRRGEVGVRLRKILFQLQNLPDDLPWTKYAAAQAELLNELRIEIDGLECRNPLDDCGCEGTCFTRGDE